MSRYSKARRSETRPVGVEIRFSDEVFPLRADGVDLVPRGFLGGTSRRRSRPLPTQYLIA